jgi:hypothetical protein
MFTERRSGRHDDVRTRRGAVASRRSASVTGDATALCDLDRAGVSPQAARYHEGEVAALSEAMRIVAAAGPIDAMPLLQQAFAQWTHRANSLSASPTPAWRIYHEGGRDALEAFLEAERRDLRAR